MGTNECSQPASKSPWDSQDFGDVNTVLKMAHFHKSFRPQWVNIRFIKGLKQDRRVCVIWPKWTNTSSLFRAIIILKYARLPCLYQSHIDQNT